MQKRLTYLELDLILTALQYRFNQFSEVDFNDYFIEYFIETCFSYFYIQKIFFQHKKHFSHCRSFTLSIGVDKTTT